MLTHNALADMYGPHFLLLYACVIALTLAFCAWAVSRLDLTSTDHLPLVPVQPDPLEIAYLRGGANEVARVAIFDLIQRGYLETRPEKRGRNTSAQRVVRADLPPDRQALTLLERDVFDSFALPRLPREIFQSPLPGSLQQYCLGYEQAQRAERLLSEDTDRADRARIGWISVAVILGLGGYKLCAALANGHSNVGFLLIMGLLSAIAVAYVCRQRWLTRRGQAYLQRLQQAFVRLKSPGSGQTVEGELALLLLSVFGVGALAGTPHAYYRQMFANASSGGGCSSGSGGCGSGSGGCGSGGGGCGGCGGGS